MTHRPKRALGQNFLVDGNLRRRIVEEVRISPGDAVLEIGPGRGALTEGLSQAVGEAHGRLILVELDDDLASELARRFADRPQVEVVHASILDVALTRTGVPPERLKVVGNIPYNLTSPILFHILEPPRPQEILLMVQREVADRILAEPGGGAYGALSVGVRAVAGVERVLQVPASAFRPVPRVNSTVLRIRPFHPSPMQDGEELELRRLTRSVFQWRRKQLGKTLRDHADLRLGPDRIERLLVEGGVGATDRPERVSPEGFVRMARFLCESEGGEGGAGMEGA